MRLFTFTMKLKRGIKKIKSMKTRNRESEIEEIQPSLKELVRDIQAEMETVCIERSSLIRSILLAVFSGSHMLLEGAPGTGKSYVVRKFLEHLTPEFGQFKILLTKDTVSDSVLGPVHLGDLRKEDSIFRYNSKNMLPEAHFAILEEVYRSRGTVLDSMLTILNERKFLNGGKEFDCPLVSAFGTTNFVSTEQEGEAFLDRWAIHYKVEPIAKESRGALFRLPKRVVSVLSKINLQTFKENPITKIAFTREMQTVYLSLVEQLERCPVLTRKITDRRILSTVDIIKAEAMISGKTEVDIEDIYSARVGLILGGDLAQESEFEKIYSGVASALQNVLPEAKLYERYNYVVSQWVLKAEKFNTPFNSGAIDSDKLARVTMTGEELLAKLTNVPVDASADLRGKLGRLYNKVMLLHNSILINTTSNPKTNVPV